MKDNRSRVALTISGEADYYIKGGFGKPVTVLVQEISKTGLRFITVEKLNEGEELDLTIRVTETAKPIFAVGEVLWQKDLASRFLKDTCVKFTDINKENESLLLKLIYQFTQSKGLKREHIRCPLITDVIYSNLNELGKQKRCISGDICVEGMRLFIEEDLRIDTLLSLKFALPDDSEMISARGIIVWRKEDLSKMVGVRFKNLEETYREKIISFVTKKISEI